jgi:hypothetical protein
VVSILEGKIEGKVPEDDKETSIWGKSRRIRGRRAIEK